MMKHVKEILKNDKVVAALVVLPVTILSICMLGEKAHDIVLTVVGGVMGYTAAKAMP